MASGVILWLLLAAGAGLGCAAQAEPAAAVAVRGPSLVRDKTLQQLGLQKVQVSIVQALPISFFGYTWTVETSATPTTQTLTPASSTSQVSAGVQYTTKYTKSRVLADYRIEGSVQIVNPNQDELLLESLDLQVAGKPGNSLNSLIDNTLTGIAGSTGGLLGGASGLLTGVLSGMNGLLDSVQSHRSSLGKAPHGSAKTVLGQDVVCRDSAAGQLQPLPLPIPGRGPGVAAMPGMLTCQFRVSMKAPIEHGTITAAALLSIGPDVGNMLAASPAAAVDFAAAGEVQSVGDQATITDDLATPSPKTRRTKAKRGVAPDAATQTSPATLGSLLPGLQLPIVGLPGTDSTPASPLPPGFPDGDPVVISQTSLFTYLRNLGPFTCSSQQQVFPFTNTATVQAIDGDQATQTASSTVNVVVNSCPA